MKRLFVYTGLILAVPIMAFCLYVMFLVAYLVIPTIIPPCSLPTDYHLVRIQWMVKHTKPAWKDDPDQALEYLIQCKSDKHRLATKMLSHPDGTVASLGMDLVVKESFEDGDVLLKQFQKDKRWNHNLALNDEYSKFMLVLWKIKRGIEITELEKKMTEGWSYGYFEKVGVIPPVQ